MELGMIYLATWVKPYARHSATWHNRSKSLGEGTSYVR